MDVKYATDEGVDGGESGSERPSDREEWYFDKSLRGGGRRGPYHERPQRDVNTPLCAGHGYPRGNDLGSPSGSTNTPHHQRVS